jgi:hypothetical protein
VSVYDDDEHALLAHTVNDKDTEVWISHNTPSLLSSSFPDELAMLGQDGKVTVIFDSGTTTSILPTKEPMSNYRERGGKVRLGDLGKSLEIVGVGSTTLMPEVLHVPGMSYGLISISAFDKQGHFSLFRAGRAWVISEAGALICSGTLRGNLYHLDDKYAQILFEGAESAGLTDTDAEFSAMVRRLSSTRLGYNDLELLHQRWAHANEQSIKLAVRTGRVTGCDCSYDKLKTQRLRFCDKCWQGRMRQFDHDPISKTVWSTLEKIGVDYKGPFPKKTYDGYIGYFLFSDQASNFMQSYLVKSQKALQWCLQDFLTRIVKATGHTWRVLQCDRASSHIKSSVIDWLIKNTIRVQYSGPYKHSQNGMVERDIGFVMDRARTIMAQYNVPISMWGFAVEYAVYTINRTHVPLATGKTAYEMVYKTVPSVAGLVPFYAPGVYHLTKEERKGKSWEFKAEPCRMLGYSEDGKHTYIVYNVRTGKVMYDRADVIFDESFHHVLRENQKNPNSQLIFELFDQFEEHPAEGQEPIIPIIDESKKPGPDENYFGPDTDPDDTDQETDSDSAMFSNTIETDFDGDEQSCEVDCDDWLIAAAAALNIPPLPPSPDSIEEALSGADSKLWHAAIIKELETMERLKVMEPAEVQTGHGMKMKLILKTAYNNDFTVKYKARLVICGYSQIRGRDFDQTYSPTVSVLVVLLAMHVAVVLGFYGGTFDVTSAFLNASNDFANFGYLPKGLFRHTLRMRILRAMYGEKQAPKLWNDMLHKILLELGFLRCPVDPCLYFYKRGGVSALLTIHVDDGLLFASHEELLDEFIRKIQLHLPKVTLTRPLQKYVGVEVHHNRAESKIVLSQKIFADSLLPDAPRQEAIPMCPTTNLRVQASNPANESLLHITGQLRYLCDKTRPDLLVATGEVSKGGADAPSDLHLRTAMKTLRYAKVTAGRPLVLGGSQTPVLFGFCDASYHADGNSKSRLGGCLFLGTDSGAFHSYSKSSTLVTQSSTHAELLALYELVNLIVHSRQILDFIALPQLSPTRIFCDSQPSIQLCSLLKMTHKTSSINMRVNFIRQCLNTNLISLHFIPTDMNVADALTKPLAVTPFNSHTTKIMEGFGGTALEDYVEQTTLVVEDIGVEDFPQCLCCFDTSSLFCSTTPHL